MSTRFIARSANKVLADSEATRQDLVSRYQVAADRISVVYPGRDETLAPVDNLALLAEVRERYGLAESYLLYVGTLHPRKNLARLVRAFGLVAGSPAATFQSPVSNLQLVLAGQKGWLYKDLLTEVRRLGLEDRVLLTGYVPKDDLAALLSGAQAFIYPSLYEGFGLPVLEAMACGTPVVCSNVSSLPEVAGDAALLVDPLDVEAIAQAILDLIADDSVGRELVARGYRQIECFSWRRCAQEALEVFEEVAGNSGAEE